MFNSWRTRGPQQARLHHLLELAQTHVHWINDAIQPSHPVSRFAPCPQSFPASGSFPVSQLFLLGGPSTGASASLSVLPMNIQSWFPSRLTCLISLLSKRFSRVFSSTTIRKHQFFSSISLEYMPRGRRVGPYLRCLFNFLNFSKTGYTNSISISSV